MFPRNGSGVGPGILLIALADLLYRKMTCRTIKLNKISSK